MRHPECKYVDYAEGDVSHRNNVVTIGEALARRSNGGAWNSYITVYRYPELYVEHWQEFKTVKGYAGPAFADYLPVDVDRETDLSGALSAARGIAVYLHEQFDIGTDQLRYFFSGAKGFHILIPVPLMGDVEPSPRLPTAFRNMAAALAEMTGQTLDLKVYDMNRLFRLPDTQHPKTMLWKVELTWSEFSTLSIKDIHELAAAPRNLAWKPHDLEPVDAVAEFFAKHMLAAEEQPSPRRRLLPADGSGIARTVADVLETGYGPGNRHRLVLAFAGYAAKKNLPREAALGVVDHLCAGDEEIEDRLRAVGDTYDRVRRGLDVHGYTELAELLGESDLRDLAELLGERREPAKTSSPDVDEARLRHVYDSDRAGEAYLAYVRSLNHRKVTIGIPTLDRLTRGLMPGMVVTLIAKARVGKSMFAQFVRRNVSHSIHDGATIFFSMEMPVELVWERDAQFVFGMDASVIERNMREADDQMARTYITEVSRSVPRAYTVTQPALSLDQMQEYCRLIEATFGHRTACVLIDYLSLVSGPGRDLYTRTSLIARGLKTFAKKTAAPVIMLAQVRRRGADGDKIDGSTAPTLEDARDSGAIEEGSDIVIGAWRPKLEQTMDDRMGFKLLKNRMGVGGREVMCLIDWKRLTMTEVQESEDRFQA